jgi:hypothetical protein
MAQPQSRSYPLTDPTALAAKIAAEGGPAVDPTQATGEATGKGVTLGWTIVGGMITITIINKPMLVPASFIWSKIDALFA